MKKSAVQCHHSFPIMVHSYFLSRIRLVSIENFLFNLTAIAIKSVPLKFSSVFGKDIHLLSAIFKLRRVTCLLSQKAKWWKLSKSEWEMY